MISRAATISARRHFESSILEMGLMRMGNINTFRHNGRKCYSFHHGIPRRNFSNRLESVSSAKKGSSYSSEDAQRRAYEHYRKASRSSSTANERNMKIASYALAIVIGAVGATYAAVPLYKAFCQATGFGGTTQRVTLSEWAETKDRREESGKSKISQALWDKLISASNVPSQMLPTSKGSFSHGRGAKTWTDEDAAERLKSLRPVENGRLITVRFDSTIGDVMPWSFVPTQLDVKVVPGETALSFFTATNHSDKAITGVATYNVHPPRAGLYFNKIQCFCFEEQRLLPGEQVDMPVFFFIDPEYATDPQLARINNITLSYTFFQTDEDDEENDDEDGDEENVEQNKKNIG
jgi:cytochrome c oxidase assembly protein subunit 11